MRSSGKFLAKFKTALLCIALLGPWCLTAVAEVTLNVNSLGVLMGANNIPVNGTLYDVFFDEGTFEYVNFQKVIFDDSTAKAASQSLLDYVFIDSSKGQFDSDPGLTNGCWYGYSLCVVYTPLLPRVVESVSPSGLPRMAVWSTLNYVPLLGSNDFLDVDFVRKEGVFILDNTNISIATWAIWSPSIAAVPEPSTYAMLVVGLLSLVSYSSRRKR